MFRKILMSFFLLSIITQIIACGQTGNLYLPNPPLVKLDPAPARVTAVPYAKK